MFLRKPNLNDVNLIEKYKLEFIKHSENIDGSSGLLECENIKDWIERIIDPNKYIFETERVPSTTLLAIDKMNKELVGMVDIRHYLNDILLKSGGHIGYSVRKSKRNQGNGKKILNLGLEECKKIGLKKVLLTCNKNNISSKKVIENNNGLLEKEENNKLYYWIEI